MENRFCYLYYIDAEICKECPYIKQKEKDNQEIIDEIIRRR